MSIDIPSDVKWEQIRELIHDSNRVIRSLWRSEDPLTITNEFLSHILTILSDFFDDAEHFSAAVYCNSPSLSLDIAVAIGELGHYLQDSRPKLDILRPTSIRAQTYCDTIDVSIMEILPVENSDLKAYWIANIPFSIEESPWDAEPSCSLFLCLTHPSRIPKDSHIFLEIVGGILTNIMGSVALNLKMDNTIVGLQENNIAWQKISKSLEDRLELHKTGKAILAHLREFAEYSNASLQLIADNRRIQVAGSGFEETPPEVILQHDDELVATVINERKIEVIRDTKLDSRFDSERLPKARSWVGLPLWHGEEPIGIIILDHVEPGFYVSLTDSDYFELMAFGEYAARKLSAVELAQSMNVKHREVLAISDITDKIAQEQIPSKIFHHVVKGIATHLNCNHCAYFEIRPKSDAQEALEISHLASHDYSAYDRVIARVFDPEGKSGFAAAYKQRRILRTNDARKEPWFATRRSDHNGPLSMLIVPVIVNDRIIGLISADHDAYGWFTEEHEIMLSAIVEQIAIHLERARRLDLLQEISAGIVSFHTLETTLHMIVRGAVKLVSADSGVIVLVDNERGEVVGSFQYPDSAIIPDSRFADGTGITYEIVQDRKTRQFDNLEDFPNVNLEVRDLYRSSIGLPIHTRLKVLGVLYVNSKTHRTFSDAEKSILGTLANNAAIGIENSRIYEQLLEENKNKASRLLQAQEHIAETQAATIRSLLATELVHSIKSPANNLTLQVNAGLKWLGTPNAAPDKMQKILSSVRHNADAIAASVDRIRKPVSFELISVNELVESLASNLEIQLDERYHIEYELHDENAGRGDLQVYGHKFSLSYALLNIMENGLDSMTSGGTLRILLSSFEDSAGDSHVHIDIADSGRGIQAAALDSIFSPTYSTNPGGIGWGLWYSRFIIQNMKGNVEVIKSDESGTTFRVSIPLKE